MSMDEAAVFSLFNVIQSHALNAGLFETVNSHEPKSAPGNGLSCSIWVQTIRPVTSSGLASTSGTVTFTVRGYSNMLQQPRNEIDPKLMAAMVTLVAAYSGDLNLGGAAGTRNVDLLGQHGESLSWQAGYVEIDRRMFRMIDITLPIICNDMFVQAQT